MQFNWRIERALWHFSDTKVLTLMYVSLFQKILNVPPPPPVDNEDDLDKDSEALHSMLIAWYMSGYHTGYYQVNNYSLISCRFEVYARKGGLNFFETTTIYFLCLQ